MLDERRMRLLVSCINLMTLTGAVSRQWLTYC